MIHLNLQERHKKQRGTKVNVSDIKREQRAFSMALSIKVTSPVANVSTSDWVSIYNWKYRYMETWRSEGSTTVTKCDYVVQLEGHDTNRRSECGPEMYTERCR